MNPPPFADLNLPLPPGLTAYSLTDQWDVYHYLASLDDMNRRAYQIALTHLQTSFSILRSNGFIEWKNRADHSAK